MLSTINERQTIICAISNLTGSERLFFSGICQIFKSVISKSLLILSVRDESILAIVNLVILPDNTSLATTSISLRLSSRSTINVFSVRNGRRIAVCSSAIDNICSIPSGNVEDVDVSINLSPCILYNFVCRSLYVNTKTFASSRFVSDFNANNSLYLSLNTSSDFQRVSFVLLTYDKFRPLKYLALLFIPSKYTLKELT